MANLKYFKGPDSTILGHKVSMPIGLAAMPNLKRFHIDGEMAAAQSAKEQNVVFTIDAARTSIPVETILN